MTKRNQVQVLFNGYYADIESVDSKYLFNLGSSTLDPHKFAQLVHLKTGFKTTTIDRYRRELEAKRFKG